MPLRDLVYIVVVSVFVVGDYEVHIAIAIEVCLGHSSSIPQAVHPIGCSPFNELAIAKVDQKTISFVSVERPFPNECVAIEIPFCEGPVRCDRTGVECRSQVVGIFARDPSVGRIDVKISIIIDIESQQ